MKKLCIFLFAMALLFSLAACGNQSDEYENIDATLHFYYEPALEGTTPNGMSTTELHGEYRKDAEYIKRVKNILENVDEWTDDNAVNRDQLCFNGDIKFSDSEFIYYFSYEDNLIYYDHYFAVIAEKDMEYIKKTI